jgi:hypothetical protein
MRDDLEWAGFYIPADFIGGYRPLYSYYNGLIFFRKPVRMRGIRLPALPWKALRGVGIIE